MVPANSSVTACFFYYFLMRMSSVFSPSSSHRVNKCGWSCLVFLMLLHKQFVSLPLVTSSHARVVLGCCITKARAIMQCPYAMHVSARWRDTCHSQIWDESVQTERERGKKKNQYAHPLHRYNLDQLQACSEMKMN